MKQAEEKPLSRRQRRAEILRTQESSADFSRGKNLTPQLQRPEVSDRRSKNRKMIVLRRKIGGFFMTLAVFSILILIFLTQFIAKISAVDASGKVLDSKYFRVIEEYLQKQPFERVVSQLKRADLLVYVQREFPEVEEISDLKSRGFGDYQFKIEMRRAVAVWEVSGKNLYVDESGVAFENNFSTQPELKIIDEGISTASNGVSVASSGFMRFIGQLISAANNSGLKISQIKIPQNALRQVEVVFDGVSFPVKFSSASSASGQVSNLQRSLKYFAEKGQTPQYIDLRIEGKAYYK